MNVLIKFQPAETKNKTIRTVELVCVCVSVCVCVCLCVWRRDSKIFYWCVNRKSDER
jgi:hypothetical protein